MVLQYKPSSVNGQNSDMCETVECDRGTLNISYQLHDSEKVAYQQVCVNEFAKINL